MIRILLFSLITFTLISCGKDSKQTDSITKEKNNSDKVQTQTQQSASTDKFIGTYVSNSYDKRTEGFDWVGVIVSKWRDSTLFIKVRSRTDQKKATCTFEGMARLKTGDMFAGMYEASGILFRFSNDSLYISNESPEDENKLFYFCSGGGSLAGPYTKISGGLDKSQMDSMTYSRVLNYNDKLFEVMSGENNGKNTVAVRELGSKNKNSESSYSYDGTITNSEIGDLNGDNFPEILIYVSSNDKSRRGSVIGFSSNNGKSLSMTGLPRMTDDPSASKGYKGFDEFAIVEGTLVQRFPVFDEKASDVSVPIKTRQIQYKLVDGEALRVFKIDKVVEY